MSNQAQVILAYGGGMDSTAIICMALSGKIEMPDHIVFVDTGREKPTTLQLSLSP